MWANWWADALPIPRGEFVPVMIITLSLTLLYADQPLGILGERLHWTGILASRVARYSTNLGDVFECARVSWLDRKLLAEGCETLLGS